MVVWWQFKACVCKSRRMLTGLPAVTYLPRTQHAGRGCLPAVDGRILSGAPAVGCFTGIRQVVDRTQTPSKFTSNASTAICVSTLIDGRLRLLWCILWRRRLCQSATETEHSKRYLQQSTQLTGSQLLGSRRSGFKRDRVTVSCVLAHRRDCSLRISIRCR